MEIPQSKKRRPHQASAGGVATAEAKETMPAYATAEAKDTAKDHAVTEYKDTDQEPEVSAVVTDMVASIAKKWCDGCSTRCCCAYRYKFQKTTKMADW
ncbi:hypothetical protein PI124_g6335 [Phytophthora idaei]|nr:hypothetical protein PI125_g8952 [Phytophthora idaei]KAG3173171.1 hypothetical protein PI126_g959 [Phytophthora idaei]KAG3248988.1 hypothetical protein PI124_g6335 [Phytophthora idaei]